MTRGRKTEPVPDSAGASAKVMLVTDEDYNSKQCNGYQQNFTHGECYTETGGQTGDTVAWLAMW